MPVPAITGAIFDMDGTILDSSDMWNHVGIRILQKLGYTPKPSIQVDTIPLGMWEFAPFLKADYGMQESVEAIDQALNQIIRQYYLHEATLLPGALAFLTALHDAGIPLAIATATERQYVEPALESTGALSLFDAVLTCPEVGAGKQQPTIFRHALAALGTPKETTWLFEDALYAIETARADGFSICAVMGESTQFQEAEISAKADCVLTDFSLWRQVLPFAAQL